MDAIEERQYKPVTWELNQIHRDISFEEYSSADAINSHGLMDMLRSPAHFYERRFRGEDKSTKATEFGRMLHFAVLEPEQFAKKCVVEPEFIGLTKDGKPSNRSGEALEKKKTWRASLAPDVLIVTPEILEKLIRMSNKILSHPIAGKLLKGSVTEATIFWQDEETDIVCKARLDVVSASGYIIDLKTTRDARDFKFVWQIKDYDIDLQLSHYLKAAQSTKQIRSDAAILIAAESESPHEVAVYPVGTRILFRGEHRRSKAMRVYAECLKTGKYPGYNPEARTIDFGEWAENEVGAEIEREPLEVPELTPEPMETAE
jgi:exodeoxyribonuclease VIII